MEYWYAYSAFTVHAYIKSYTIGVLTMVKGATQNKSMKQKINTKRSTEAKLVSVNDVLSHMFWISSFLKHQVYDFYPTLHQNNTSSNKNNGYF